MASVWKQMAGETEPTKLIGGLDGAGAMFNLRVATMQWCRAEANRTFRRHPCLGMDVLLFEGGTLAGSLFVEPCSPPSAPEPGQPKRAVVR